jgi:uncharacterized RDD family membrane protein YckC
MIIANIFVLANPRDILILFGPALPVLAFIFWIVELVDALRRTFPEPNAKIIWVLVIVLLNFVGAAIYYFVGKRSGTLGRSGPGSY